MSVYVRVSGFMRRVRVLYGYVEYRSDGFRKFFTLASILVYYFVCIDKYRNSILCSSFGPFYSNRLCP
jgi:hypothetical protein